MLDGAQAHPVYWGCDAILLPSVRLYLPLLLYGGAGRRDVRGGNEQDGIKTAQSFEIPGRDLTEDAALFFGLRAFTCA